MGCMGKNTTKVRNIKGYMMAELFNAGSTIGSYYKAEVNHDMRILRAVRKENEWGYGGLPTQNKWGFA